MKTIASLTSKVFVILLINNLCNFNIAFSQTVEIGPNQYAFQYTNNPNFGLFFNSTDVVYEFRNGSGNSIWSVGATNGKLWQDLEFTNGFSYRVPANSWAIRSASAPNAGIYFGSSDFEFRRTNGQPAWSMNAITGASVFGGEIATPSGSSSEWNEAFSWGDHSLADYAKVGANLSATRIPSWDGAEFVTTNMSSLASGTMEVRAPSDGTANLDLNNRILFGEGDLYTDSKLSFSRLGNEVANVRTFEDDIVLEGLGEADVLVRTGGANRMRVAPSGQIFIGQGLAPGSNDILYVNSTEQGIAISGVSDSNPGSGTGVYGRGGNYGVQGVGVGGNLGDSYGLFGIASGGSSGNRYGVYATAFGGSKAWAGYFVGDTYVSGNLRLGDSDGASGYKLSVDGKAIFTEVRVQNTSNWPDFVFDQNYELPKLEAVKKHISEFGHLPGIPSKRQLEEEGGADLGEMQKSLLKKVEELTLYIIEQNERLQSQQNLLDEQGKELEDLKSQILD